MVDPNEPFDRLIAVTDYFDLYRLYFVVEQVQ